MTRQVQDVDGSLPYHRSAPSSVLEQGFRESLGEKAPLEHIALEGETTKLRSVPPPTPQQLDNDKLELDKCEPDSWTHRGQLTRALMAMHQAVRSLSCKAWWATEAHKQREQQR